MMSATRPENVMREPRRCARRLTKKSPALALTVVTGDLQRGGWGVDGCQLARAQDVVDPPVKLF